MELWEYRCLFSVKRSKLYIVPVKLTSTSWFAVGNLCHLLARSSKALLSWYLQPLTALGTHPVKALDPAVRKPGRWAGALALPKWPLFSLPCTSYATCLTRQALTLLTQIWAENVFMLMSSSHFPIIEKPFQTNKEKLLFPPEQGECLLCTINKIVPRLQQFSRMGGAFSSAFISQQRAALLEKHLDCAKLNGKYSAFCKRLFHQRTPSRLSAECLCFPLVGALGADIQLSLESWCFPLCCIVLQPSYSSWER